MKDNVVAIGLDIGSTTVKAIVINHANQVLYNCYRRHYACIRETVCEMLQEILSRIGNCECVISMTGSGGMNLASQLQVGFVQEVVAVTASIREEIPQTDAAIELGGEDAKIIFLTGGVEQRMNGICAGGTGAFIDQMAGLLQTDADGLNKLAESYQEIYPIAARCGVFAKSDIQPLINDGVPKEDLAASILQAVVNQTISGLACGRKLKGNIAFLGGPLHFLPELRKAFERTLHLEPEQSILPENGHMYAAMGAAFYSRKGESVHLESVLERLKNKREQGQELNRLEPLFCSQEDYEIFRSRQDAYRIPRASLSDYKGPCYLGMDAGSTTLKVVLLSENGELLYEYYSGNHGDPLKTARDAVLDLYRKIPEGVFIRNACATGYGETLMKDAFRLDEGEVETIAHFTAAKFFSPNVDCILDIGGQDMKCIRIRNGCVDNIILNEACSAGCGSFLENFSNSMGYTAQEFSQIALFAEKPVDLGTRCTVFMNSNVKQAQKEGTPVEDIAAGLAYSVVKNALFKVIKLAGGDSLGDTVVVQGGTFYNDAVLRGLEHISGQQVIRPDIAGLMGAFGAALIAKERAGGKSSILSLAEVESFAYKTKVTRCRGCENQCRLTVNLFSNGRRHLSGNRCERGLDVERTKNEAPNVAEYKVQRVFAYEPLAEKDAFRGIIGIPRTLNLYEDYPFWAVFFRKLGYRIELSPFSNQNLYQLGMDSIPSESECFPAKLAHGHIAWLAERGIKTIFYPCIFYEREEREESQNRYNCPMVISYPENIRMNMDILRDKGIRYLSPFLPFSNEQVLSKTLSRFMKREFGIAPQETEVAVRDGWKELLRFREDVLEQGKAALRWIEENNGHGIVIGGRPYHLDPSVNHGIPEMIHSYGFAVLTEDSVAPLQKGSVNLRATNQWVFHARLYAAAQYVARREDLDMVQLNSFGCGLDAITIDQVQELLESAGKIYTLLKIDEVNNLGAARIRVRSMMAALDMRRKIGEGLKPVRDFERKVYTKEMQEEGYTILCPGMMPMHFDFVCAAMKSCGYNFVNLGNEGQTVVDLGQQYVNNDACYPATIVTGQLLDALKSGRYDTDRTAVIMVQTGGGCRASNYVGFLRKAFEKAGFGHVPVISLNVNGMEKNPGFHFTLKMVFKLMQAIVYGDIFMRLVYRIRPYEAVSGSTDRLFDKWKKICVSDIEADALGIGKFYRNCETAIREFDEIHIREDLDKPKVGIVGEVLVKFMPLANNHLVDIIEQEGAEAVVPDFTQFLQYCFWNAIYRRDNLGGSAVGAVMAKAALTFMDAARQRVFRALECSRRFCRPEPLKKVREAAQEILQLGNQCGEGWFLPGEILDLIQQRVENIVCVQPFGCLPNHIVGKGIIKRVRELYPQANIVSVDYDPSASKVNQLNRIKLMLEIAEENEKNRGILSRNKL